MADVTPFRFTTQGQSFELPAVAAPWIIDAAARGKTFHDGGIYRSPAGMTEGLALLLDGERVLAPGEFDKAPVQLIFQQSSHDPGAVLGAFAWAMAGR